MNETPLKEELRDAYWTAGLSTRKLAAKFCTNHRTIIRLMKHFGIPRRNRIDAVIRGCTKYVKPPFSGELTEKAYLLGLALADFRRRKHGYQIDISLSTTHPAFARLFRVLFEKYAPIHERPRFNFFTKRCEWSLEAQLHSSFSFLLGARRVPDWVTRNQEVFLHFLAGYADGEGTISIGKNSKRCVSFVFAIASGDKSILAFLFRGLKQMGFHPSFRRSRKAGDANYFWGNLLHYKKDRWVLRLKRRDEVLRFLKVLPIRHPEKIEKRDLMLRLKDRVYLCDVDYSWSGLKNRIGLEVDAYVSEAALRLRSSSSSFSNSDARV